MSYTYMCDYCGYETQQTEEDEGEIPMCPYCEEEMA